MKNDPVSTVTFSLALWMCGRDLVLGGHLEAIDEQPFLAGVALDDREPRAGQDRGLHPLEGLRHGDGVRVLLRERGDARRA